MDLTQLRYAKSHEWTSLDGTTVTIGITQFAVDQLTDVTYLELPIVGKQLKTGDEFGVVESVKSTSPLISPVTGEVIETNPSVVADTAILNTDPYGKGWLMRVKLSPNTGVEHLMTKAEYDAQVAGDAH